MAIKNISYETVIELLKKTTITTNDRFLLDSYTYTPLADFCNGYRYYKNHQKGWLVDFPSLPIKEKISEKSTEPRIRSLGNHKFLIFPLALNQGIF